MPLSGGSLTVIADDEGLLRICRSESVHQSLGNVAIEAANPDQSKAKRICTGCYMTSTNRCFKTYSPSAFRVLKLGTLNDSEAARWLYLLASAQDRVSLGDVLTELQNLKQAHLVRKLCVRGRATFAAA